MSLKSDNYCNKIIRDDLIVEGKTKSKGAASENKIWLGREINTRELRVCLPDHKCKSWNSQILEALSKRSVSNDI